MVWLSVLLLVPLIYIVLSVFQVQRSAFAVTEAAKAAGRAYATAPDEQTGRDRAVRAAHLALRDQRLDPGSLTLDISCRPDPGNCLAPGAMIDVRLRYPAELPLMPSALGGNTPSIRVSAEHSEPYGTFRDDR
ncbi:MAG: hypothetical protein QM655_06810 [Nocardioidaceae bacterium]